MPKTVMPKTIMPKTVMHETTRFLMPPKISTPKSA